MGGLRALLCLILFPEPGLMEKLPSGALLVTVAEGPGWEGGGARGNKSHTVS